jgi:hypothetical protein
MLSSVYMGFVVDKVALGQVHSEYLISPEISHSIIIHIH